MHFLIRGQTPQLLRDVPYARLVDGGTSNLLPQKLDSDSKLHTERSKSILSVPEADLAPKCSVSDSKLAVDYFNSTRNLVFNQVSFFSFFFSFCKFVLHSSTFYF